MNDFAADFGPYTPTQAQFDAETCPFQAIRETFDAGKQSHDTWAARPRYAVYTGASDMPRTRSCDTPEEAVAVYLNANRMKPTPANWAWAFRGGAWVTEVPPLDGRRAGHPGEAVRDQAHRDTGRVGPGRAAMQAASEQQEAWLTAVLARREKPGLPLGSGHVLADRPVTP